MDISPKACSLTATGFFFLPSICIAPFNSSRYGAASALRRGPSFCTTGMGLHCTSCTISNFSDCFHFLLSLVEMFQLPYFPTMLYPTKAKNRQVERAWGQAHLTIFYIFPSYIQYIYWLNAEKIEPDFLTCAYAAYSIAIFPGKYVHIYNRVAWRKRRWRLCWLVTVRIDCWHILPRVDVKAA